MTEDASGDSGTDGSGAKADGSRVLNRELFGTYRDPAASGVRAPRRP